MLFLHLLDRTNSSAKISELGKFLLDFLQPLVPLAVSDLRRYVASDFTSILSVQLVKLGDLNAETTDLFPKDFEVIHVVKNSSRDRIGRQSVWPILERDVWYGPRNFVTTAVNSPFPAFAKTGNRLKQKPFSGVSGNRQVSGSSPLVGSILNHLPVRQSHTGLPLSSRNIRVSVPFTICRARITSEASCFTFEPVTSTLSPLLRLRPTSS